MDAVTSVAQDSVKVAVQAERARWVARIDQWVTWATEVQKSDSTRPPATLATNEGGVVTLLAALKSIKSECGGG